MREALLVGILVGCSWFLSGYVMYNEVKDKSNQIIYKKQKTIDSLKFELKRCE